MAGTVRGMVSEPADDVHPTDAPPDAPPNPGASTPAPALGWADDFAEAWESLGSPGQPGRISRLDRGWSTVIRTMSEARGLTEPLRLRNIGADVAVGDWVVPSDDGERVE